MLTQVGEQSGLGVSIGVGDQNQEDSLERSSGHMIVLAWSRTKFQLASNLVAVVVELSHVQLSAPSRKYHSSH